MTAEAKPMPKWQIPEWLTSTFVDPLATSEADDGRREIRLGAVALFGFFGVFLGSAAVVPMDAAVVAPGVVAVSGSRQAVQHRDGGVVARLAVVEGQHVRRGDILLELSAPEVAAQKEALASQVADLEMQQARLSAEMTDAHRIEKPIEWASWPAEDRAIAEAAFTRHMRESATGGSHGVWSEFGARMAGYRAEVTAINRQEDLIVEELQGLRELARDQLVAVTRVRATERSLADLQGRRGELQALIATTRQSRSEKMREAAASLAEYLPKLAAVREQMEQTRVRAPEAGAVVGLSVHTVGGVIKPGEHLMDIVPDDRALVIEAQVRPDDMEGLKIGQSADVRITACKGRNLPILKGQVRAVSADRLLDERTGQGYFRVEVSAPAEAVKGLGADKLRAGLPAQIIVPTRKRTALQYLLEPLNQALWGSFREA
jgi:HlyD family secretion protein